MKIRLGLIDDHRLFLKSLVLMLESFGHEVILEAYGGADVQEKIKNLKILPDIMLIDVNMPDMDGIATAAWLKENYPSIKLVALTMNDKEQSVISMFRSGCCAYLLKDIHPAELESALKQVIDIGYYNSDSYNLHFRKMLKADDSEPKLTPREQEFLKFACSDMTYREVAAQMNLSERTVDGYREILFQKFHVQSRLGLCLEALRRKYVEL